MQKRNWNRLLTFAVWSGLLAATGPWAVAENWPQFRGPGSRAVAEASNLPTEWNANRNIVWKQELPGPGSSSPIVWNGRVYVTCYSGYAESIDDPGNVNNLVRHVVCLDRATGKLIWTKPFKARMPESKYAPGNDSKHGYASSTPVTDGEHLYVFFGISGVYCLDMDGNEVWNTKVGDGTHGWGSGTSPLLYEELLIVNASVESQSLIALNKQTGGEVWKIDGIRGCWSSPVLVEANGKQELVLSTPSKGRSGNGQILGLDPATGQRLWFCDGIPDGYLCPTALPNDEIVYVIGGRRNTAIAVRAGGRGNVTDSHVLWRVREGSNVASPVYLDGYLYWFHERDGKAICLDANTGKTVYEERFQSRPGLIYSSVVAADGKLYAPSQENGTYVVAAKPQYELLAVNKIPGDETRTNASMAVVDNQLLLRTDKAIYCIGQ